MDLGAPRRLRNLLRSQVRLPGGASSHFPYLSDKFASGVAFPLSPQNAAPPALSNSPPVNDILVAEPNLKLPRTYEWNAALEQSLGKNQSLSLAYIGTVGRDLLRSTDLDSPNSNFGFVGVTGNSATSNYNAPQVKFERRLWQGLQVLASNTWSHSIDIASDRCVCEPPQYARLSCQSGYRPRELRL